MLKTWVTELFGVERPIVQGGLMWIATAELTSAVANAGGMGFMTALTFAEPEDLAAEIRKCRCENLAKLPEIICPTLSAKQIIETCYKIRGLRIRGFQVQRPSRSLKWQRSG